MQSWNQPCEILGRWCLFTESSSAAIYWSWLGNLKCEAVELFFPRNISITVKDPHSELDWLSGTLWWEVRDLG